MLLTTWYFLKHSLDDKIKSLNFFRSLKWCIGVKIIKNRCFFFSIFQYFYQLVGPEFLLKSFSALKLYISSYRDHIPPFFRLWIKEKQASWKNLFVKWIYTNLSHVIDVISWHICEIYQAYSNSKWLWVVKKHSHKKQVL